MARVGQVSHGQFVNVLETWLRICIIYTTLYVDKYLFLFIAVVLCVDKFEAIDFDMTRDDLCIYVETLNYSFV